MSLTHQLTKLSINKLRKEKYKLGLDLGSTQKHGR